MVYSRVSPNRFLVLLSTRTFPGFPDVGSTCLPLSSLLSNRLGGPPWIHPVSAHCKVRIVISFVAQHGPDRLTFLASCIDWANNRLGPRGPHRNPGDARTSLTGAFRCNCPRVRVVQQHDGRVEIGAHAARVAAGTRLHCSPARVA